MEKQMKCSHCGQVFTTIPDRNSLEKYVYVIPAYNKYLISQ